MAYGLFKWHFSTAVHFGTVKGQLSDSDFTLKSDALFSALCLECLKLGGEADLQKLYDLCDQGRLLLTDTMPFYDEIYYLPKPMLVMDGVARESSSSLKKDYKKLRYISAEHYQSYVQAMAGKGEFDVTAENQAFRELVTQENRQLASVTGLTDALPYYMSTYKFAPNAGLYFIVRYEDEADLEWLESLVNSLGYSGVGGKKTVGLGKFEVEDVIFLEEWYSSGLQALENLLKEQEASYYMTLSGTLPKDEELDQALVGAYYGVSKRGGFIDSTSYATQFVKKKPLYVLNAGACFQKTFQGAIYQVAVQGQHPVYRYAKPFFMGVMV